MKNTVQRNYLEIKSVESLLEVSKPNSNLNILPVNKPDHQLNKFFYKEIGKKHNWFDRLSWNENCRGSALCSSWARSLSSASRRSSLQNGGRT